MKTLMTFIVFVLLVAVNVASSGLLGTESNPYTLDFVNISGATNPDIGHGIVKNDCRIGPYELTNVRWNKFTNIYGTPTDSPSNAYDESSCWTGTNLQICATNPGDILYQENGSTGGWNYYPYRDGASSGPWDAGSGSEELKGTFDMTGNARGWTESPCISLDYLAGSGRRLRNGAYFNTSDGPHATNRHCGIPYKDGNGFCFRVCSVPEPCGLVLLGLGGLALRKRKRG